VLGELEKLADSDAKPTARSGRVGAGVKEGIYEDYERRDTLLKLARFHSTASAETQRSLKDYVAGLKPNQTAIYTSPAKIRRSSNPPSLEGFRAAASKFCCWPTWSTACG